MRTQLTTGDDVKIVFRHTITPIWRDGPAGRVKINYQRHVPKALTECLIVGGTREVPVEFGKGVASCSWLDPFVKERGRQLSLQRAVATLGPENRGRVLQAYYNRQRGSR